MSAVNTSILLRSNIPQHAVLDEQMWLFAPASPLRLPCHASPMFLFEMLLEMILFGSRTKREHHAGRSADVHQQQTLLEWMQEVFSQFQISFKLGFRSPEFEELIGHLAEQIHSLIYVHGADQLHGSQLETLQKMLSVMDERRQNMISTCALPVSIDVHNFPGHPPLSLVFGDAKGRLPIHLGKATRSDAKTKRKVSVTWNFGTLLIYFVATQSCINRLLMPVVTKVQGTFNIAVLVQMVT